MNSPEFSYPLEELVYLQQKVADVDDRKPGFRGSYSVFFWEQMLQISKERSHLSLRVIEETLRARNSTSFIVAVDIKDIPPGGEALLPHTGEKRYPFFGILARSPEEARIVLLNQGITPQQNLERLKDTGLLYTESGSEVSRRAHSRDN